MDGLKKPDGTMAPSKRADKGAAAPAEPVDERVPARRNPRRQRTRRTQGRGSVPQAAGRMRQAAGRSPKERLAALLRHIAPEALSAACFALKRDAAAGADGATRGMCGAWLEERPLDLHRRLHGGGACLAPPVRRAEMPKPDGGTRPLGIAAPEDGTARKAVADAIPTPIREAGFPGFSCGFRPGRGAHGALDAPAFGIERRKAGRIVDADTGTHFDTIPRDWLTAFPEHRIGDRRVIRLIRKRLDAGVMDDGKRTDTGTGTPRGAAASPVPANILLHCALGLRFRKAWRPEVSGGRAIVIRCADDVVAGFEHRRAARRHLRDVRERLDRFSLGLRPDRTRLVEFGRFAQASRRRRGEDRPATFDFPGSRTAARRPGKGDPGLGGSRLPGGSRGPSGASTGFSARDGIMTSGKSESGRDWPVTAGSTALPFPDQAGASAPSAAGCNARGCNARGCGRCAGDPVATATAGNARSA